MSFTEGRSECIYPCCTCPIGTSCDDLASITLYDLPVKSGYFRLSLDTIDVRRCPDAAANCTGKSECSFSSSGCAGGRSIDLCQPGLHGPFCRLCKEPYHFYVQAAQGRAANCKPCSEVSNSPNLMVLIVVVGLGALLIGLATASWHYARKTGTLESRLRSLRVMIFDTYSVHVKLKVLIGFYQVITKIERVYDLFLPEAIRTLLANFTLIISLGIDGIPLSCVGARGYQPRLAFWSLVPVVVIAVAAPLTAVPVIWKHYFEHRVRRRTQLVGVSGVFTAPLVSPPTSPPPSPTPVPQRATSRTAALKGASRTSPLAPAESTASFGSEAMLRGFKSETGKLAALLKSNWIERTVPVLLKIFFLLYPIVTNVAFEGFSCCEQSKHDRPPPRPTPCSFACSAPDRLKRRCCLESHRCRRVRKRC